MSIENKKKNLREFGIVFGVGLPLIFGFLLPKLGGHEIRFWTFYFGFIFLFLSLIYPKLLFWPYKFWMYIGHLLGWINSRLILGIVYILVLLPISVIMKLCSYKPLKTIDKNKNSYQENTTQKKIDLTKIF